MFQTINKSLFIVFFSYLSLILGFYFQEDFAGGAQQDYILLQVDLIKNGFFYGPLNFLFEYYPKISLNHSPIYYILIYYLQSIFGNFYTKLIILHFFLLIPFIYHKTLNLKFKKSDLLLITLTFFFLSANYRSLAIWSGREIIAIFFLISSIFFYFKFLENQKLINIYASFSLLIVSSYLSPEIGIISLIFLYESFKKLTKKEFIILLIFNIIASIPFVLFLNFYLSFKPQYTNDIHINLVNNLPYFFSSILVYTIPFILVRLKLYFKFVTDKFYILLFCFIFFYILNLQTNIDIGGGGIYSILKKINFEEILFIFSGIGIFNLIFLLEKKTYNIFVLCIFIIQTCVNFYFFQKYLDIYWIIYFIFFLKIKNLSSYLNNQNFKALIILIYCSMFLTNIIMH